MKSVLVVSGGIFHPPLAGRLALHQGLASVPGFKFQTAGSLESLPPDLEQFSALVLYYHQKTISNSALAALDKFVSAGGGVLALHSATASFKQTPMYFKILGGRFIGHGPVETFSVLRKPESSVFDEVEEFKVHDELYLHEVEPDIEIHFTTMYQDQPVPVVWTRSWGRGRVCYAVPGHTASSMTVPALQKILRKGLVWVSR